jgi:hypothetical protein
MVREIKTRKTKFIEEKAMEMKNINFISAVKKKRNENCVSLFFATASTPKHMLVKSSWHSCWFYDRSIVLADTMSNTKKPEKMKVLKLLAIGIILLVSSSIHAQVSIKLNIGTAPSWGPFGYAQAAYYYLPDVHAYYDIRASQFVYFGNNRWVRSRYLPRKYRNYDLYNGYKVVLNDYHGNRPYAHYRNHRQRYSTNYRNHSQRSIGQRHDDHRYTKNNHSRSDNRRYTKNRRYSDDHRYAGNHKNKGKHGNKRNYDKNRHGQH